MSGVLACSDARANQLLELSNNDVQQAVVLHHELADFDVGPIDHQRAAGGQGAPQAEPRPQPAVQEQEGRPLRSRSTVAARLPFAREDRSARRSLAWQQLHMSSLGRGWLTRRRCSTWHESTQSVLNGSDLHAAGRPSGRPPSSAAGRAARRRGRRLTRRCGARRPGRSGAPREGSGRAGSEGRGWGWVHS